MEALSWPDWHAGGVMLLSVLALWLFATERLAIETTSVLVITLLALGFGLFPYEAKGVEVKPGDFFAGFGNEALIAICALMVASEGLARTGALTPVGRWAARLWSVSPRGAMLGILVSTAVISAFMTNTPQVVMMIPILVSVALRAGTSPSRLLMPMTFSAQIGGMLTPIGSGLNLLVLGTAERLDVPAFGMFDFVLLGGLGATAGVLYLWLLAPLLLPDRESGISDMSPRVFDAVLHINEDSAAHGKTLADVMQLAGGQLNLTRIERGDHLTLAKLPVSVIRAGDRLFVRDRPETLKELEDVLGATLYDGRNQQPIDEKNLLAAPEQQLAEIVVTEHCPLSRRTLSQVDFSRRYDLIALALHRGGREHRVKADLSEEVLRPGDVLLVQGTAQEIGRLKKSGELMVLDATTDLPQTAKAPWAVVIMAGVVVVAATGLLPVSSSALAGVLVMMLTGCLRWRDATQALDAPMIFLTAASIALSYGMVQTGGAEFLARSFVAVAGGFPGPVVTSALILLMALLANFVSNSAAAVIGTPIAVSIAHALGLPPEPFVLAVLFGANMAYCTPMADNCNLLVFSAGGYRFADFMRVGIPLTLIMWLSFSLLLPLFYPLSRG